MTDAFWPGPLTVVVPTLPNCLSTKVTAGLDTVGIRMPNHPVSLALIKACNLPIAAPSANTSGKPSPTTAEHVTNDLNGKIAGVINDGSSTKIGLESTVLDCSPLYRLAAEEAAAGEPEEKKNDDKKNCQKDQKKDQNKGKIVLTILRPGGVTQEQMQAVLQDDNVYIDIDSTTTQELHQIQNCGGISGTDNTEQKKEVHTAKPRAPGMKYTHYAPRAPLFLVDGSDDYVLQLLQQHAAEGKKSRSAYGR